MVGFFFHTHPLTSAPIKDIQHFLDSLNEQSFDTAKVDMLNKVAIFYLDFDLYKALQYINKSEKLADSIHYQKGYARALDIKGSMLEDLGELAKAFEYKQKAIDIFTKIGSKFYLCKALNNMGVLYFNQGKFDKAIEYYTESLYLTKELNDHEQESICYLNLGEVFFKTGDYNTAEDYQLKSLEISEKYKLYSNIGYAKGILGQIYLTRNYCNRALMEFTEAISNFYKQNENSAIAEYNIHLARSYLCLNRIDSAIAHLEHSLQISSMINAKSWKKDAYTLLSEIYAKQKNFQRAYEYALKVHRINDTIYNEANAVKLAQIQATYETARKEAQIELLKHQREAQEKELQNQRIITYLFIFGTLTISILAIGLFRSNNKRAKMNALLLQRNKEVSKQKDELNTLNNEITLMNREIEKSYKDLEREKNLSEKLLLNILPEPVAKELKENGKAIPKQYTATILFADFVNFTGFAAENSPQELIEILEEFFMRFDEICNRYQLEKIKTIGDSYMAAGGVPTANDTHAYDAVYAAIHMLKAVKAKNWQIRIGVHTGPVIAGVIGKNKFAYDVWGDTVNIASRMESSANINSINISNATYQVVNDKIKCEYRGCFNIKNRGSVDMYEVLDAL